MNRPSLCCLVCLTTQLVACSGAPTKTVAAKAPERSKPAAHPAPAPPVDSDETLPETLVHSSLVSSASAIRPGKAFLLAVRLDMLEGYRIFWKNPGDFGKSTRVRFTAPEGFEVSEPMYPKPERFTSKSGFTSYGYEEQTAIFVEVRAPRKLDRQQAYRFDVEADWFACKKQCASEQTQAFFEMTVDPTVPAGELDEPLSELLKSVPRPFSELSRAKHNWTKVKSEAELALSAPKVEWLDFYSATRENPKLVGVAGAKGQLKLRYETPTTPPETVRGVAIIRVDGAEQYYDVEVPWEG